MHNEIILTQNLTAYKECQIFLRLLSATVMGFEGYVEFTHIVKEDMAQGLIPKQIGNSFLDELRTLMN